MILLDDNDRRPLHLMGVAGAGMNALAELLLRRGARVSGCDLNLASCENLAALGAELLNGHDPGHLAGCRALVVSSAIPQAHPELLRARELEIPVVRRAEALAELVGRGDLIAIAGTHGKTTTTVMTTVALESAGLSPTGVAGGRVGSWGGNLYMGGGKQFVVEADEYDRSFLALDPDIAVVTNIEADHLDIYVDLQDIEAAFRQFVSRAPVVVVCEDDPVAAALSVSDGARRVTYGLEPPSGRHEPEIHARDLVLEGKGSTFSVWRSVGRDRVRLGEVELQVPGVHNVRNALAALGAGLEAGGAFEALAHGLGLFRGVERRFEIVGVERDITVVDDYAHHPTEIQATISAARAVFPGRRLLCAFQPHLYTRTRDFASDFGAALADADAVLLTEIYPARETPIQGVHAGLIEAAIRSAKGNLIWRGERAALDQALRELSRPGDVVLTLGAGDITHSGRALLAMLKGGK